MMIMTLCLAVYSALEYKARKVLKEKLINNPTMKWVFSCFMDVVILTIKPDNQIIIKNLQQKHHSILHALGQNYEKYYL